MAIGPWCTLKLNTMSTQNTGSLQLTAQIVQNMISSRAIVRLSDVGQTKRFHIRGNGNIIAVTTRDGAQVMSSSNPNQPLVKKIFNIQANSHVAMLNERNRAILREAMQAESVGDMELAHSKFNEYLNRIQVSFSVILNARGDNAEFYNKQLVEGEIELVTTDNGQLLTISNARAVRVEKLAATPAFTLSDLMGLEAPAAETVLQPIDAATGLPFNNPPAREERAQL